MRVSLVSPCPAVSAVHNRTSADDRRGGLRLSVTAASLHSCQCASYKGHVAFFATRTLRKTLDPKVARAEHSNNKGCPRGLVRSSWQVRHLKAAECDASQLKGHSDEHSCVASSRLL